MKKSVVFAIFILLLAKISIHAQNPPPRSPLAIQTWKEFIAPDGSFKILFPKPPEIFLKEEDPASKRRNVFSASVSATEKYSLHFRDKPAPVIDDMEREAELVSEASGARSESVIFHGYSGTEYVTDSVSSKTSSTKRLFIVKQRFFTLAVTTPLLKNLPPAARQSYQRKINAFFNSFIIGDIPPAEHPAIPVLPDDYGSILEAGAYSNKYFGFKITLPPNLKIDYLHQGRMQPSEKIEYEKESLYQRWLRKNNPKLILAYQEPKPSGGLYSGFLIQAFRPVNSPNLSLREFADERKTAEENYRGKLNLPVQPVNLNSKRFLMFEIEIANIAEPQAISPLKERWYVTDRNGVFLTFSFRYRERAEEALMMKSMSTLTFFD